MSALIEHSIVRQLAKGQDNTNDRLDAIVARLDRLIAAIEQSSGTKQTATGPATVVVKRRRPA